jgi:rSAM/selenodomain-associated transferase 1
VGADGVGQLSLAAMVASVRAAALVVLAKSPRPGRVKTRLCPPLSLTDAARLHEAFLQDTVERLRSLGRVQLVCAYTPPEDRAFFEATCHGAVLLPQGDGDLGERLRSVFATLAAQGFGRIVAIGADTPALPLDHVREAFTLLDDGRIDMVLGPALDGGYYLIGLRAPRAELFADMPWSTDRVFAETHRRAGALGLLVGDLPARADVDTFADLLQLVGALRENPGAAPHSHAALRTLGLL